MNKYKKIHLPLFSDTIENLHLLMKQYGYSEFVPFIRFIVQKFITDHDKSKCDGQQG